MLLMDIEGKDSERAEEFFKKNKHLTFTPNKDFHLLVQELQRLIGISSRLVTLKSYFLVLEQIVRGNGGEEAPLNWEDRSFNHVNDFISACALLDIEISKKGNIYYAKGQAETYKDSRSKREVLSLTDPAAVSKLTERLIHFDKMGDIERNFIEVGCKYLWQLINLLKILPDFVTLYKSDSTYKQDEAHQNFRITRAQYKKLEAIAAQYGLVETTQKKESAPTKKQYKLSSVNTEFIDKLAASEFNNDRNAALNNVINSFREILARSKQRKVNHGG